MKHITFTFLILLFIPFLTFAQLNNGLVAHWPFSGNANDISGNGLNGTAYNITYTTGRNGVANTAAKFNGSSSYIKVPYSSKLNNAQFSICAYVKVEGYSSGTCQANAILWRGTQFTAGYYSLIYFDNPFVMSCQTRDTSKNVFAGQVGTQYASPRDTQWRYTPTIISQNWYCVTTTFNGSVSKVYVDGVLKSTYNRTAGAVGSSSQDLGIGVNMFNMNYYPYWFEGTIDDIRIYDRVLTPAEISSYCSLFDTTVSIAGIPTKTQLCADDTFSISYTTNNVFNSGNSFTAELSDATGSFANPLSIGTTTATNSGTINCHVPANLTTSSNYKIRIKASNPLRYSDNIVTVGIFATLVPSVTISATQPGPYSPNQYITFIATPTNAGSMPTYLWMRNGQPIPGANNDTLHINTLNDGDSIYVKVLSSNPCPPDLSANSNIKVVHINTGINELKLDNLSLYPNPNEGNFMITADNILYDNIHIDVCNLTGQTVYSTDTQPHNNTLKQKIDISVVSNGMYILRISADGFQRNIRFIKKH